MATFFIPYPSVLNNAVLQNKMSKTRKYISDIETGNGDVMQTVKNHLWPCTYNEDINEQKQHGYLWSI